MASNFFKACCGEGNTLYLDLSSCNALESQLTGPVIDTGDPTTTDILGAIFPSSATTITKIPASLETRDVTVVSLPATRHSNKVEEHKNKATVETKYLYHGENVYTGEVLWDENGKPYFIRIDQNNHEERIALQEVTFVTYVDENNNTQTFNSRDPQNYNLNMAKLTKDGDDYYYIYYKFQDKYSQQIKTLTELLQIEGVIPSNEYAGTDYASGYAFVWFTYTDENGQLKEEWEADNLSIDSNGNYVYNYFSYIDMNNSQVKTTSTKNLLWNVENAKYVYVYYTWNNGNEKQEGTSGIIVENDQYYKVNAETNTSAAFNFGNGKNYINGISFPNDAEFTFIPNELFINCTNLKKAVLSETIVAVGNEAFSKSGLEEVNFPSSLSEIGIKSFEFTNIKSADLSKTAVTKLRAASFEDCKQLESFIFPKTLKEIHQAALMECYKLKEADMSDCHDLVLIANKAFENDPALATVRVCSHQKVIKGGEGSGAFNNCSHIKTVEVVGCSGTDVTLCICENNAFSPDITYVQTALDNIEPNGARLIFPEGGEFESKIAGNTYGYGSCFDYFVGNYKVGIPFKDNQSVLEKFFKFAPRGGMYLAVNYPTTGVNSKAESISDTRMAKDKGIGNGWHEFMNVSAGIIIPNDKAFLRTYSRTKGTGPVLLTADLGITAYRAIEYKGRAKDYVESWKGDYVLVPANLNPSSDIDEYLTKDECEAAGIDITGLTTYSYVTTAGTLYLRPLRPKYAGTTNYNTSISYVPENTGVVLYSAQNDEDLFLILPEYTGTEYDLKSTDVQYPHTKFRHELTRTSSEPDNINMLEGSFTDNVQVAPVWPWNFKKNMYDVTDIQYREFAYSKSNERWMRLQPGVMVYNRAYAKIPADLFTNPNEQTTEQRPDFTIEDLPADSQGSSANTLLVLDNSFDNMDTDGIETINAQMIEFENDAWYTLQGVKVAAPTKGGVYIHNNKKVVVK